MFLNTFFLVFVPILYFLSTWLHGLFMLGASVIIYGFILSSPASGSYIFTFLPFQSHTYHNLYEFTAFHDFKWQSSRYSIVHYFAFILFGLDLNATLFSVVAAVNVLEWSEYTLLRWFSSSSFVFLYSIWLCAFVSVRPIQCMVNGVQYNNSE